MVPAPATRYARSGDARIAFQVIGDGPPDVALIGGPASHLDVMWDNPDEVRKRLRLASFARIVRFDRRGTGLSDPVDGALTLDQQMDDLDAVLEAVGIERVALIGEFDVGLCAMYAATHPERVSALVLANVRRASVIAGDDRHRETMLDAIENHWGEGMSAAVFAPTRATDPRFMEWWKRMERSAASPSMARKLIELSAQVDLREVLPAIQAPTLVLHRRDNQAAPLAGGRDTAALIPGARFVALDTDDHFLLSAHDWMDIADLVIEFVSGTRPERRNERSFATVVFTDIVASTSRSATVGDEAWCNTLDSHDRIAWETADRHRGTIVKSTGDGLIARFDSPLHAVAFAHALRRDLAEIDLRIRCGVHTGEIELREAGDISGTAVNLAARVEQAADDGTIFVSSTVRDMLLGGDIQFEDRGEHVLKGFDSPWRLYALLDPSA